MFEKEYDVFIAYHGSYSNAGTAQLAKTVYDYLTSKKLKCFFFPESKRDLYKANIIDVMKSKVFLLICNENLNLFENGRLDSSQHYELSTEIDAFYALTQFGTDVSVQDSKVVVCGDFYDKRLKGQEERFHELFASRTHIFYENNEISLPLIYDYVNSRLLDRKTNDLWNEQLTSSEVKIVFAKRSSMSQHINLPQLIASSKSVRCLGISNSEVTTKIDPESIRFALLYGAEIDLLFLDPDGVHTPLREKEEQHRPNRIKNITHNNIESALDLKESLPPEQYDNYRLYKYDLSPRMNVIILDNCAILQYYANSVYGLNNPCFFIQKQEYSPLYDFCVDNFNKIKSIATEIKG